MTAYAPITPALLPRRVAARVVDGVLLAAAGVAWGAPRGFDVTWLVAHSLVVFLYFVVLDTLTGSTAGKRLFGLRVTGAGGRRPTLGQAVRRELFTLVGAVPYAGPLLALAAWAAIGATARSNDAQQGVHDALAGGTRVVTA